MERLETALCWTTAVVCVGLIPFMLFALPVFMVGELLVVAPIGLAWAYVSRENARSRARLIAFGECPKCQSRLDPDLAKPFLVCIPCSLVWLTNGRIERRYRPASAANG